ncbi:MAG: acyloxyacyl hydrolase [Nitrospirae bacterium]|nr:MAG: acyloxyacyl hydrolase [Nitrospirota bacterium]
MSGQGTSIVLNFRSGMTPYVRRLPSWGQSAYSSEEEGRFWVNLGEIEREKTPLSILNALNRKTLQRNPFMPPSSSRWHVLCSPHTDQVLELPPHVRCRYQLSDGLVLTVLGVMALRSVARQHGLAPAVRFRHERNPTVPRLWPDPGPRVHHYGLRPQLGRTHERPWGKSPSWRRRRVSIRAGANKTHGLDPGRPPGRHERQISFWEGPEFTLPWGWQEKSSGLKLDMRLLASAGELAAAADTSLMATLVPCLALSSPSGALSIDVGAGAAVFSNYKFGAQNFGGPAQIVGTAGVGLNPFPGFYAGYRFQHFSDAGIYGPTSLGVDMHIVEIAYRF